MIKRFLSILLVLALSVTMFTFVASAEETTFTINWANDPENLAFSSTYSPYTLAGTELTVSPTVTLKDGQEIHWFLNGNKVGTSGLTEYDYAENFTFKSVDGVNAVQAKVMEGDTVVTTSDIIEKTFTPIVKSGSDLFANDLTAAVSTKWYYGGAGAVASYVSDPAGSGRNVLKIDQPAGSTYNSDLLRIKAKSNSDYFTAADTGSGIVRIDYSIYADNNADKIDLANLWFYNGSENVKNNYTLYADDYIHNGATVIAGPARSRNAYLPQDKWVNVCIVIDNVNRVYDVTVDGVQATTGRAFCSHADCTSCYFRTLTLPAPLSKNGNLIYYLKDVKIYKCTAPSINISPVCGNAKAVAGSKVVINAESTFDNADIVYWCNGVKYEDNKVLASAGTNTVYAQAIGESGNVLGTSDPITFEAYADDFNRTYYQATSTPDASGYIRTSNLFPGITNLTRLYYQSVDVDVENLAEGSSLNVIVGSRRGTDNKEIYPTLFKFTSDSINIAKTLASNMVTVNEYITIPRIAGQNKYNIKTIYDTLYGAYIILLDDVVYSVIDVSATNASVPSQGSVNGYGFLYLQVTQNTTANFTNYSVGYSALPVAHSKVDYINNEKIVTNASELTNADDLTVRFVATKGEYEEVLCIATVIEKGGELISLATQDVTFDETKDSEEVSLELKNLPSDIAGGNYTVNVMLWNKADLKPIVTKVVMP